MDLFIAYMGANGVVGNAVLEDIEEPKIKEHIEIIEKNLEKRFKRPLKIINWKVMGK